MPLYEYICERCKHSVETLQGISEPLLTKCPRCNEDKLVKQLNHVGGFIFKGPPFSASTRGK